MLSQALGLSAPFPRIPRLPPVSSHFGRKPAPARPVASAPLRAWVASPRPVDQSLRPRRHTIV